MMESGISELAISEIGQVYGQLRMVKPQAEAAMEKSIRQFGQMQPIVCALQNEQYELIDGFKRYRAIQKLGQSRLKVRIAQPMASRLCKTLMVQLNQQSLSINRMEEALIIQSLHREEKLKQIEIAVLFGRDKSWVCRRLTLVEKVHEEVQKHIMLGLLPMLTGRELSRLPRGNQEQTLACVLKHRLSSRETAKLVEHLIPRPRWEYEAILRSPWEVLAWESPRQRPEFVSSLHAMRKSCLRVKDIISAGPGSERPFELIQETITAGKTAVKALRTFSSTMEEPL